MLICSHEEIFEVWYLKLLRVFIALIPLHFLVSLINLPLEFLLANFLNKAVYEIPDKLLRIILQHLLFWMDDLFVIPDFLLRHKFNYLTRNLLNTVQVLLVCLLLCLVCCIDQLTCFQQLQLMLNISIVSLLMQLKSDLTLLVEFQQRFKAAHSIKEILFKMTNWRSKALFAISLHSLA